MPHPQQSDLDATRRELAEKRAALKATFIVHLGMSPSEYDRLTIRERDAILREANKRKK